MRESDLISSDSKELAYDLRQIYASLVGTHLIDITESRKQNNYSVYLENLQDLYTVIRHKFKDKDANIKKYDTLLSDLSKLANDETHRNTWLGTSKNPQSSAILINKLRQIEMFLFERMEEANMFGQKYNDDDDDL